MKISRIIFLLLGLVFVQCDKPVDPAICPDSENKDWYKELIGQYKPWSHEKVEIYSYTYNSQMVIGVEIVEPTCCDFMSVVYDCSGNVICQFGGFAGLNTCPDFATTATDKKLLFKN
jgi:hypothetical protein